MKMVKFVQSKARKPLGKGNSDYFFLCTKKNILFMLNISVSDCVSINIVILDFIVQFGGEIKNKYAGIVLENC